MKRTPGTLTLNAAGWICAVLASTAVSRAADIYWTGGDGLWSDATWNPQPPVGAEGDHVFIEDQTVTIQNGIDATAGALIIRADGEVVQTGGTLALSGGDYFNVYLAVGDFGTAPGTFTMSGGTLNANGGRIAIGLDEGSDGEATISGGTLTHSNELWVGQGGGTGKLTVSGTAQVNGTSWFGVGREGGTGELIVKDSAKVDKSNGGYFKIAGDENSKGTVTIEGSGQFICSNGVVEIASGTNTEGTLTIKDSGLVEVPGLWTLLGGNGTTATLNLDGGFLKTNWIGKVGGTATINFNGGTLIAQEGGTSYLSNFAPSDLHVKAGGFKFNTDIWDVTIVQALSGEGSVTKLGAGILRLPGAHTYEGNTTVQAGQLILSQAGVLADDSTVTLANTESLLLSYEGTEVVDALIINGVPLPDGPYIFGTGTLYVGTPPSDPFGTWALANGLDGTEGKEDGLEDDPDKDGQSNLLEFAFNGDPLDSSNNGQIHGMTADSDYAGDASEAKELILTIAVLADTPAFTGSPLSAMIDGTTYTVEGSLDLDGFPTTVHEVTPVTDSLPEAGEGYEYRSFSLDGSDGLTGKGFLRAKVVR